MLVNRPRQYSFENVPKDMQTISEKLMSSQTILKLLYHTQSDALHQDDIVDNETLIDIADHNILFEPEIRIPQNNGSLVIISFDQFRPNETNPAFLDNLLMIDILCPTNQWEMETYQKRPFAIMAEMQKLFSGKKLNGIGKVNFLSADLLRMGDLAGYQLGYEIINDSR